MRFLCHYLFYTLIMGWCVTDAHGQGKFMTTGAWCNESKSVLTISRIDYNTGEFWGVFQPSYGPDAQKFPLIGWVTLANNDGSDKALAISFMVRGGKYGASTHCTGYFGKNARGVPTITTVWTLGQNNTGYNPGQIIASSDVFTPR